MHNSSTNPVRRKLRPKLVLRPKPDFREQLFNDHQIGTIESVSTSAERIYQLHALMWDIDPLILRSGALLGKVSRDPVKFYRRKLNAMLDRHELLRLAEVRNSGRGLHVLLWFAESVQLDTDRQREELSCIYDVLLPLLPSDPHQPRLTAITRKVGSVNSKSGTKVEVLKRGMPVPYEAVRQLAAQVASAPFRAIVHALLGEDQITPCPICGSADSRVGVRDHVGICYECGKITLEHIFERLYRERKENQEEVSDA